AALRGVRPTASVILRRTSSMMLPLHFRRSWDWADKGPPGGRPGLLFVRIRRCSLVSLSISLIGSSTGTSHSTQSWASRLAANEARHVSASSGNASSARVPDMSLSEWLRALANIVEVRREQTRYTPIGASHAVDGVMRSPEEYPPANSASLTSWSICESG